MLLSLARFRRAASIGIAAILMATTAVVVAPLAPARHGVPVAVVSRDLHVAVNTATVVDLPFPASHVALHWPGDADAVVSVAFSPDGTTFGAAEPVEPDEVGDRAASAETYTSVLVAGGATRVRLTADRPLPDVTVVVMNSGSEGAIEPAGPGVASAASLQPAVISRAAWGATESLRFDNQGLELWPRVYQAVQKIVIHHTAGPNYDPNPAATVRSIEHYDAVTKGWSDIGYNFLIDSAGHIYEGRASRTYGPGEIPNGENGAGLLVTGAHALDYNSGVIGIAMMGTFTNRDITPAARASLEKLIAWESERHGIDPLGSSTYVNPVTGATRTFANIAGHRNLAATACPGGVFYATLPALRNAVAARIAAAGSGEDVTPPTITAIAPISRDPSMAGIVKFGVVFSEAVQGLGADDFIVTGSSTGWTVASVGGGGAVYQVTLTSVNPVAGDIELAVTPDSVQDPAGNVGPLETSSASMTWIPGAVYVPLSPSRILDTRTRTGLAGPLPTDDSQRFAVAGAGGVPAEAIAVTGNLTVTGATKGGYVSLTPLQVDQPATSTVNFPAGDTRANGVTVTLGPDGSLAAIYKSAPGGSVQLIFDVTGYYLPNADGAVYVPLSPSRILDTRTRTGLAGPLPTDDSQRFAVAGAGGVPAEAIAVTGNLTVTGATKGGYVSLTPLQVDQPATSTVNFPAGDTRANGVTVTLGPDGSLAAIYKSAPGGSVQLIFDVTGYYR